MVAAHVLSGDPVMSMLEWTIWMVRLSSSAGILVMLTQVYMAVAEILRCDVAISILGEQFEDADENPQQYNSPDEWNDAKRNIHTSLRSSATDAITATYKGLRSLVTSVLLAVVLAISICAV